MLAVLMFMMMVYVLAIMAVAVIRDTISGWREDQRFLEIQTQQHKAWEEEQRQWETRIEEARE